MIAEWVAPYGVGGEPDYEARCSERHEARQGQRRSATAKSNASSVVLSLFTKYKFLLY